MREVPDGTLVAVVGPTASGKTRRAVQIARHFGGEIISADSRQLYRSMDIGTGKDIREYGEIPCHLIDICEPGDKYNLHRYLQDYRHVRNEIESRGALPVLCGGSGMYVEAALNGIVMPDVERNEPLRESLKGKSLEELTNILSSMKTLHNVTDVDTVQRALRAIEIQTYYLEHPEETSSLVPSPEKNAVVIGVDIPREVRRNRITQRLENRFAEGMLEEVRALLDKGVSAEALIYYGLEYKWLTLYLIGEISFETMKEQLEIAIHQFAKRQMTWFRGMERRGWKIHWLPWDLSEKEFIGEAERIIAP